MTPESERQVSEQEIISRVLHGESDQFRVLVERYQRLVFALGMRFFRNRDDAYDFAQEAFIRAYQRLYTFRGEARFSSWLTRLAYNHGVSMLKSRAQPGSLLDDTAADPGEDHVEREIRREARVALREAMEQLPQRYVVCIELYFFFGLKYSEISDMTGFPINTIKSHVRRAKVHLRRRLRGTAAEAYHEV
jgi:RNA polymerase sigma-70 factor, ECF subfamily